MGKKATITVHPGFAIGEISNQLFSAFLEPIGTMVNGTMYNPKHPTRSDTTSICSGPRRSALSPSIRLTWVPDARRMQWT